MQDIIRSLEEKYGGSIRWKVFSIWYGDSDGNIRDYGVLLFQMDDGLFRFHDFKHIPKILGIEIHPKNEEPYEPFDGFFRAQDVTDIATVTRKDAARSVLRGLKPRRANAVQKFFRETVTMVCTKDKTFYFEFPNGEFIKLIKETKENK